MWLTLDTTNNNNNKRGGVGVRVSKWHAINSPGRVNGAKVRQNGSADKMDLKKGKSEHCEWRINDSCYCPIHSKLEWGWQCEKRKK